MSSPPALSVLGPVGSGRALYDQVEQVLGRNNIIPTLPPCPSCPRRPGCIWGLVRNIPISAADQAAPDLTAAAQSCTDRTVYMPVQQWLKVLTDPQFRRNKSTRVGSQDVLPKDLPVERC